jgi:hypothetical protein
LALEGDVLGPSHESGEVTFGLHVVAHPEVAGSLLEERVRFLLDLFGALFGFYSFCLTYSNITIDAIKIIILI